MTDGSRALLRGLEAHDVEYTVGVCGDTSVGLDAYRAEAADEFRPKLADVVETGNLALVDLPTKPLPDIENVPVDWLEPDE